MRQMKRTGKWCYIYRLCENATEFCAVQTENQILDKQQVPLEEEQEEDKEDVENNPPHCLIQPGNQGSIPDMGKGLFL
jgi:hypothetical protein